MPSISYNLTQTDLRLLSPQNYHQIHSGHYVVHSNQVIMHLPFHRIPTPVDIDGTNLLVPHNLFVTEHQKREIGPQIRSSLAYSILSKLDIFGDLNTIRYLQDIKIYSKQMKIEHEFKHHYYHFFGTCVGAPENQNLSGLQEELLLYHWNLLFSMYRIKEFMRKRTFEEPNGNRTILPSIINPKFTAARNCSVPACESCMLERAKKRSTNTKKFNPLAEK